MADRRIREGFDKPPSPAFKKWMQRVSDWARRRHQIRLFGDGNLRAEIPTKKDPSDPA